MQPKTFSESSQKLAANTEGKARLISSGEGCRVDPFLTRTTFFIVTIILFNLFGSCLQAQTPGNWITAAKTERELFYEAVGTIQPRMVTTLSSKVTGNVLEVLKREGDSVKEGEIVLKIDAKDIASDLMGARAGLSEASAMANEIDQGLAAAKAQKDQVEAALKLAENNFNRIKGLFDKKSVSKQEFDQAEAQLSSSRAQLRSAEAQIEGLIARRSSIGARMGQAQAGINKVETIKNLAAVMAPFSGRVTSRRIEPGMLAAPGVPLLVIEDDSHLRFEAIVPESLITSISDGMSMSVVVDALSGQAVTGTVAEIVPAGDAISHTFLAKIAIPRELRLRSGMYARGRFPVGKEQVLLVPMKAVETRGQLEGLWIERNGKPAFCLVRTGRQFEEKMEILSGLIPGDQFLAESPVKGSDSK